MGFLKAAGDQQFSRVLYLYQTHSVRYMRTARPWFPLSFSTVSIIMESRHCLVDVIVMGRVGLSVLHNSSGVDGLTPSSPTDWSPTARASYLLCRGTWGSVVGQERVRLLP